MRAKWQDVASKALNGNAPPPAAPLVGQRREPIRAQTRESEVSVPLQQAMYSGLLLLLAGATEMLCIWLLPWLVALGNAAIWLVILATWFVHIWLRNPANLWKIENVFNVDLDGDKQAGPPAEPRVVRLERHRTEPEHEQYVFEDIPIPRKTGYAGLITFVREIVYRGVSFSERSAAGYGYSRAEWEALRDIFRERHWAEWKDPNEPRQGVSLTGDGLEILEDWANEDMPRA